MRLPTRTHSAAVALMAIFLGPVLAGCGGGGGGGGGAAPTNFNTAEFQANFGLGSINVLSTYSGGFTGTGQTIAVIDTGIDVDHPDLDANIAAASTDIVTSNAAFLNDIDGHGTQVSGVAAAERNSVGTHGVAFNSQILAIRADSIGSCLTLCSFTNTDVADAIDFAVANGAGVINLSIGGSLERRFPGFGPGRRECWRRLHHCRWQYRRCQPAEPGQPWIRRTPSPASAIAPVRFRTSTW